MLQRNAIQKLHDNERMAFVPADFVDRADFRMVERGRCTRLAAEAFERLRVLSEVFGQEFQGDETTKLGVLGFVHDPHPAHAEFLDDAVVRDRMPDELGGCAHWRKY